MYKFFILFCVFANFILTLCYWYFHVSLIEVAYQHHKSMISVGFWLLFSTGAPSLDQGPTGEQTWSRDSRTRRCPSVVCLWHFCTWVQLGIPTVAGAPLSRSCRSFVASLWSEFAKARKPYLLKPLSRTLTQLCAT